MILFTIILFLILGGLAQYSLRRKLRRYEKEPSFSGLSGKEIAEKMLQDNRIYDVRVVCTQGALSDHYNPVAKTINLSPTVHNGRSVAAAAVAAHECGHAVQHARAYSLLQLRTALVPIQNLSARVLNFIFIASLFGTFFAGHIFSYHTAMVLIASCYFVFTLFSFITLPVEFDASRRALLWIQTHQVVRREGYRMAKDALQAAAMTYVVAALASLTMFLQYLLPLLGSDD